MKMQGRSIVPGHVKASALVARAPFSFVGGCDSNTGEILDAGSGVRGKKLKGCVFAFPHGKGSTVGSYVVYGLAKRKRGPAAMVVEKADPVVAVGAILADLPMVEGIDVAAIRTGDSVIVDAASGEVELPEVQAKGVVSAFLRHRGRILLVQRSHRVGSFRGRWSAISGYLEGGEDPAYRARQEIREETGIRGARLRTIGRRVIGRDKTTAYIVHPFLFDVPKRAVRLDWENVDARWIRPADIEAFDTVPRLKEAMTTVLPSTPMRR